MSELNVEVSDIVFHECRIARRGKGAKGTVEVQTIGVPEVDDNGVAKSFDYSYLDNVPLEKLLEKANEISSVNQIIGRAMDLYLRSAAIKSQATTSMLQARIIREDLARDKKEAKNVALSIVTLRTQMTKLGIDPISIDDALTQRKKIVDKLKAEKNW